jgi:hypothetical protein
MSIERQKDRSMRIRETDSKQPLHPRRASAMWMDQRKPTLGIFRPNAGNVAPSGGSSALSSSLLTRAKGELAEVMLRGRLNGGYTRMGDAPYCP